MQDLLDIINAELTIYTFLKQVCQQVFVIQRKEKRVSNCQCCLFMWSVLQKGFMLEELSFCWLMVYSGCTVNAQEVTTSIIFCWSLDNIFFFLLCNKNYELWSLDVNTQQTQKCNCILAIHESLKLTLAIQHQRKGHSEYLPRTLIVWV